jgi:hypothetical protein
MLALRSAATIVSAAVLATFGATQINEPTRLARDSTPVLQSATLPRVVAPATCPITKPPLEPFVPPAPYPTKLPAGSFWLGSEKLWTNRYMDGVWHGYWVTDTSGFKHEIYYDKVFWWRKGYDWRTENPPQLTVAGKRLDAEAPSLYDDRANAAFIKIPAMVTGIDIPTVGCREITVDYKGDKLAFVVWVVP